MLVILTILCGFLIGISIVSSGSSSPIGRYTGIVTAPIQKGLNRLREAKVENHSLSNLDVLAEVAVKEGYISAQEKVELIQFRDNL